MSAIQMMRTALFGSPPQANWKPDRQGVLDAFTVAAALAEAGIAAQSVLPETPTDLPYEVTAITGGIGTGSGGLPGVYAGGVSGGPPGFAWSYTIGSDGTVAGYTIDNPGISLDGAVPTLSFPLGYLGTPTAPTATVGTVPVNRIFYAIDATGDTLLLWGNNAGSLASAPFGETQMGIPLKHLLDQTAGGYRRVDTYAEREAIPLTDRNYGMVVFVMEDTPRAFMWVPDGEYDPMTGVAATSSGWVGLYTILELKNLGIDFTGILPAANVEGLIVTNDAVDDLAAIEIADFRALAQTSAVNPPALLQWAIKGQAPDSQVVSWGASSIALAGSARSFVPKDWAALKPLFIVGNSLSDTSDRTDGWPQLLAADRGVGLFSAARYSSDANQVYRCGAESLYLTLAGGVLPTGGTSASVSLINGLAPSADLSVNPASFLNTGDPAITTNLSMTGTIVAGTYACRGTVSIPNGASTAYSIVQDAGGAAIALTGPVLFIPDLAQKTASCDLIVWMGNNYFYSGVPNSYGDHTNPQMWVDLAKMVAKAEGNRVLILPVIPDSSWSTSGTGNPYTAMQSANARTEALYPAYVARDAAGRTLLQRLQASGDGSSNDNADIAAGFVPRSLHRSGDTLHLNSAGQAVVYAFVKEALVRQSLPSPITQDTAFTLRAVGTNPRTGDALEDIAVATVQTGPMAALADQVSGSTANSEYRPTLAEAVADLPVDTYFSSRDTDAVGPHAGVRWNYKRIAAAPYWQAIDVWAGKDDVGLGDVANLAPADLPVSNAQAALINQKTAQIAYVDFTTKADGLPPSNLDTGQAVDYTFNASGRRTAIESGRLVVYNKAAAGSGDLADYYQSDLGAPVVRVGCEWTMPAGADDGNGNITYAAWNGIYEGGGTVVPRSWVHMSIIPGTGPTGTAQWFIVRGVAGAQNILSIKSQTFTNPPADGLATWSSEAVLDADAGMAYASLPDGSVMSLSNAEIAAFCAAISVSPAPTFADLSATVIVCEHYCNAGANTAKFGGFKNLYGETQASLARALKSKNPDPLNHFKRFKAVRDIIPPSAPTPTIYAPSTQMTAPTTTSMTNIDATNGKITAVAGVTGKIIWRVSAYYEWTGSDTVFWRLAGGAGTTTIQAADVGVSGTKRTVHGLFTSTGLTPGQSYTMTLQHSAVTGGLATLKAGGSGGGLVPPLTIAATPA